MNGQAVFRVYNLVTGEIRERCTEIHVHPTGDKLDYIGHREFLKNVGELIGHSMIGDEQLKDFKWGFKLLAKGQEYDVHDDSCRPEYDIDADVLPAIRGAWNQYNNKEV